MTLLNQFIQVRKKTEDLCSHLETEDFTPQSAVFASPPKWHLAHTTWFFEEMILKKFLKDYVAYDNSFSFLFNSYYNSIGERIERSERGLITRPSISTVFLYREHVEQHITELLNNSDQNQINQLIILGINHEQQHQELLLTDLKHTFSKNPIYPVYRKEALISSKNKETGWTKIEEGIYSIGHSGERFSFDNELGQHKVFLETFEIATNLVTNREFIEFINDGGYRNHSYWLDEAWSWLNENKIETPLYWKKINNEWHHYTLSGLNKINPSSILCHVSYYESAAFAQYKNRRLPTEFEWEIASKKFEWGERWEWTNSAYLPYPRFIIKEGAVGEYNGKFMINQMVLRGASSATTTGHSRNTYRNFFHPSTQWQFSGIRLVKKYE